MDGINKLLQADLLVISEWPGMLISSVVVTVCHLDVFLLLQVPGRLLNRGARDGLGFKSSTGRG